MNSNKKLYLTIILVVITGFSLFFYFKGTDKNDTTLPTVSFRQGWFTYAGFAGEVFAMDNEIDSVNGIDLKVEQGADDIDPVKLVLAGKNDFGITSAEAILTANEKGANLVIVGVVNHLSPTCFISLEKSGIKTPSDFVGKRVGVLTGTETETVYKTMVRKLSLDSQKISEVEAPYDLKTFINGEYDVYPGFFYSEPVALDFQNIRYNVIKPSDYGINLMGAVYFTTGKYFKEHPKETKAFVSSISKGWEMAISNPKVAISKLYYYDNKIDTARELVSLNKGVEYFKGENNKVLYVSDGTIQEELSALYFLGKIKDTTNLKVFQLQYVGAYHDTKK